MTSDPHRLGALAGLPIWEILYTIKGPGAAGPSVVAWKSILVQTGDDSYREIYHLEVSQADSQIISAWIVKVDGEEILATDDSIGGNGGQCWERYWWFDSSGPHPLDFSRVKAAMTKRVPSGATFWTTCWALHLEEEIIDSTVQGPGREMLGDVTAHFRLRGALAEPVKVEFKTQGSPVGR